MNLLPLVVWIVLITSTTLFGSWYARKTEKPDMLIALYVTFVLVSQILAVKISAITIGNATYFVPTGVFTIAVTFLLTDIVNEKFGRRETIRMIGIAFFSQIAALLFFWFSASLSPAPFWPMQDAWKNIFGIVPRITLASLITFLVSEHLDAYLYSLFMRFTKGRHLWARNALSTLPSLLIDSILFVSLAFYGIMPILPIIIGQIVLKWIVGLIDIPFMYLNRFILTKKI